MCMEIEDRYVTSTPEGVSLSFVLAGLGSRASAYLIDFVVQLLVDLLASSCCELVVQRNFGYLVLRHLRTHLVRRHVRILRDLRDPRLGRSLGKRALGIRVTLMTDRV